jgi:hypothetical protein
MKGKVKNLKFYSQYISNCSKIGINTDDKIKESAQKRIIEIDNELKRILSLREERSNLLDVVYLLEKK